MSKVTVELDDAQVAQLQSLRDRTGLETDEVIGQAIDVLATAIDQAEDTPPLTEEQEASIRAGLSAIDRGDVSAHEDVFETLRRRYGR